MSKKVYAIIVVYNGLSWLEKCIGSLRSSSIPINILVIDNGSTDGSIEYITANFVDIELFKNSKNIGFGQANNIGIKKAYEKGSDHILLLNQDAWVEKNTIQTLVEHQVLFPQYGIVSPIHLNGKADAFDPGFERYINPLGCPGVLSAIFLNKYKGEPYAIEFVNAACWLISRACIQTIGGFSSVFYHYGEDDNYIHRVYYHGLKVGIVPLVIVMHDREHRAENAFSDEGYQQKKQLLVKFSNPLSNHSIDKELAILQKLVLKNYLRLSFNKNRKLIITINKLKEIKEDVEYCLKISKKKGLNYLT